MQRVEPSAQGGRKMAAVIADAVLAERPEAGWPGERTLPEAGANRVYSAVRDLRKLGLRDVLVRADDGYRLDPRVSFAWAEP